MQDKFKVITRKEDGREVRRIKALRDGKHFKKGDIGGIIVRSTLSQDGECWLDYCSEIYDSAISGDVEVINSTLERCMLSYTDGMVADSTLHAATVCYCDINIVKSTIENILTPTGRTNIRITETTSLFDLVIEGNAKILGCTFGETSRNDKVEFRVNDSYMNRCKFGSQAQIYDSTIAGCTVDGPITLANTILINDTVHIRKLQSVCPPILESARITGSTFSAFYGEKIMLCTGLNLSDFECDDIGKVSLIANGNYKVARVPGKKWFFDIPGGSWIPDSVFEGNLYSFLKDSAALHFDDVCNLVYMCLHVMHREPRTKEKARLKLLYIWLSIRRMVKCITR